MISKTKYLIVGAGLTGLSTAYHLSDDYLLAERFLFPGGNASTFQSNGFKLDNSVHVLYFRDNVILNWMERILKVDLLRSERVCSVWISEKYIPFPVQYNLSFFPLSEKMLCTMSLIQSIIRRNRNRVFRNFEEYSQLTFGKYLTEAFIRPYNEKLFGVLLSDLNTDWLGDYVPKSSTAKMLMSTIGINKFSYGRNSIFYYPKEGGISAIAEKLSSKLQIKPKYNFNLAKINLNDKIAVFNNNTEINYDFLINTIPLNDFLSKCDSLPGRVLEAANCLKKNSTTLLHIMVKGTTERKEHWIYIADNKIPFYRITFPGNINSENCPVGYFSLTLEFGGDVFGNKEALGIGIAYLKKMKILNASMTEMDFHWQLIDCGYVVYDKKRNSALSIIFSFLEKNKIYSAGRYGAWEYSNMEAALLQGKIVAEQLSKLK